MKLTKGEAARLLNELAKRAGGLQGESVADVILRLMGYVYGREAMTEAVRKEQHRLQPLQSRE